MVTCDICGKRFKSGAGLAGHTRLAHNVRYSMGFAKLAEILRQLTDTMEKDAEASYRRDLNLLEIVKQADADSMAMDKLLLNTIREALNAKVRV
ncbi:unnamed protein product [marine sediment metagenome]|uniref:C2H2-type domain-containing protein n=1 Tax=marine sediment metagenome TaxID=412755 RepID=X1MPG7_9ZZZZ